MIARTRAVTSGVLTALAATAGLGLALAAPAAAIPAPSCLTVGTVTTSTQCTVAPGESVFVQFKGGNGGPGGFGGAGGAGGFGWDGAAQVFGGVGGIGGIGGIGGAGAAVSGVYTNATANEVVLTVTLGASGAPGTAGAAGILGTDAPQAGPANGGHGGDGLDGTDGAPGIDSELAVDGVPFIVAGAGTQGLLGTGGTGGFGGASNGGQGLDGTDGAPGAPGVAGTTTPAQLPAGWTTFTTGAFQAPFASFSSPFTAPLFTALTPQRLLDTRETTVVVGGAAAREVDTAGVAGVPADAAAVVLNVTATGSTEPGFVTVYPCGTDLPGTSTVNFATGQTVANSATVSLGSGKVCVYSKVDVHVVLDVNGAYSEADGTDFLVPLTPARLLDTRENGGAKIPASTVKELAVAGESGVPADASAVVLNVTVTEPDNDGYLTLFPCGADVPLASNVNYVAGQTVPNQVTVKVGVDGKVCATGNAGTHLVVDVDAAMSPNGSAFFQAQTPLRLVDTRETAPRLSAGVVYELTVDDGQAGATAAALNVTVTNPVGDGYVTVFPCGTDVPTVSNLNFTAGQTVANAVTTGLTANKACVLSTVDTDIVVDLSALFVGIV